MQSEAKGIRIRRRPPNGQTHHSTNALRADSNPLTHDRYDRGCRPGHRNRFKRAVDCKPPPTPPHAVWCGPFKPEIHSPRSEDTIRFGIDAKPRTLPSPRHRRMTDLPSRENSFRSPACLTNFAFSGGRAFHGETADASHEKSRVPGNGNAAQRQKTDVRPIRPPS